MDKDGYMKRFDIDRQQAERFKSMSKMAPWITSPTPYFPELSKSRSWNETRINCGESCQWAENASFDIRGIVKLWLTSQSLHHHYFQVSEGHAACTRYNAHSAGIHSGALSSWCDWAQKYDLLAMCLWFVLAFLETTQDIWGWGERTWQAVAIETAHTHIGAPEIWSEDLHVLSGPVTICDTDPWLLFLNCSTDTSAQGWRTAQPGCKVTKSFQGDLQNLADLSRSDWPCLAETAFIDENVIDQGAGAATPCAVGKRMEMQRAWNELTRFCHFSLHSWTALALQQLRSWIGKIPRVSEEAWDWGWTMIPGSQWHLQNLQARILVSGHECRSACLGIGRFRVTLACLRMRCPRRGSTWGCWHRPFCNLIPPKMASDMESLQSWQVFTERHWRGRDLARTLPMAQQQHRFSFLFGACVSAPARTTSSISRFRF